MKTKVIAFRVTQDEYDALVYMCNRHQLKLTEVVAGTLRPAITAAQEGLKLERKRLEAKAKREAKKAAANGAQ